MLEEKYYENVKYWLHLQPNNFYVTAKRDLN